MFVTELYGDPKIWETDEGEPRNRRRRRQHHEYALTLTVKAIKKHQLHQHIDQEKKTRCC